MILHNLLYKTFILLTVLNLIKGDKFIGKYLYSKVKNHLVSTSHGTNHKLWMEYLEKRLETISMFASIQLFKKRQIFSVVQYYKRNVERKFLKKVHSLCTKQYEELQTDIVGSICGSTKNGISVTPPDEILPGVGMRLGACIYEVFRNKKAELSHLALIGYDIACFNFKKMDFFVGSLEYVTCSLGFKDNMDPLFVCFLTCMQWIPQLHLWCNNC